MLQEKTLYKEIPGCYRDMTLFFLNLQYWFWEKENLDFYASEHCSLAL